MLEMDMRFLKTFSTCLVALALHGTAWAEIYETTDAQGNPDFTDSPPDAGTEVVNLPETNVIDAPEPEQQEESQPQAVESGPAPVQENNTVIIHDDNDYDGYDDEVARQRALERRNLAAPGEVVDPGYEMPREVGDSEAQMPHEVGDSEAQMPHEVGDVPGATGAHRR
jgi:Domain of unknown function (DUF4124)